MECFHVWQKPWGVRIRMEGEPTDAQRAAFTVEVEAHCLTRAGTGKPWVSLIEIRNYTRSRQLSDKVAAVMHLARACGHVRCAILVDDWTLARELADAILKAGCDDQARIFLPSPQNEWGRAGAEEWAGVQAWIFRDLTDQHWSLAA